MNTTDSIWGIADICSVALYVWSVMLTIRYLRRHRQDCFTCSCRDAWLRSGLLAFLVTPSLIADFWLFSFPGPAALGFALLLPGIAFADGHRLELVQIISILYVLPWIACTAIIFYVWRFIRWRRMSSGCD